MSTNKADTTAYKYSSALIPINFTICGVVLKPFSMGHMLILESLASPLVSSEKSNISMEDGIYNFFAALLVCAQSYEDNLITLNNDNLYKETMSQFIYNLMKNIDFDPNWNIYSKLNMFKEYMDYYMDIPFFTEQTDNSNDIPSGTDWKQNIFVVFKKMGYTESEILNMNFKKLFYEWCSWAESEGGIKVWNKYEVQQYESIN